MQSKYFFTNVLQASLIIQQNVRLLGNLNPYGQAGQ